MTLFNTTVVCATCTAAVLGLVAVLGMSGGTCNEVTHAKILAVTPVQEIHEHGGGFEKPSRRILSGVLTLQWHNVLTEDDVVSQTKYAIDDARWKENVADASAAFSATGLSGVERVEPGHFVRGCYCIGKPEEFFIDGRHNALIISTDVVVVCGLASAIIMASLAVFLSARRLASALARAQRAGGEGDGRPGFARVASWFKMRPFSVDDASDRDANRSAHAEFGQRSDVGGRGPFTRSKARMHLQQRQQHEQKAAAADTQ